MKRTNLVSGAIVAGLLLLAPQPSPAQDLRGEIEAIIKDYLAAHPDEVGRNRQGLFRQASRGGRADPGRIAAASTAGGATASTSGAPGPSADTKTAHERSARSRSNAAQLFSSPHQVTLGNPDGDADAGRIL